MHMLTAGVQSSRLPRSPQGLEIEGRNTREE